METTAFHCDARLSCFDKDSSAASYVRSLGNPPSHRMTELDQIRSDIRKFRDERDWMQFHNPKNLACSIAIETAELLEHFQWKTPEESASLSAEQREEISHEVADILTYLIEFADNLDIDPIQAIRKKMALNAAKYPVEKARGSAVKYDQL